MALTALCIIQSLGPSSGVIVQLGQTPRDLRVIQGNGIVDLGMQIYEARLK